MQQASDEDAMPPPLAGPLRPSPRRREHPMQPPALTTNMTIPPSGYNSNPNSTSSLSGPFSQTGASPYAMPTVTTARGISPMASRLSTTYAVQYNPQEWGPVSRPESRHTAQAPQQPPGRPQADGTLSSPPPPYSPGPKAGPSRTSTDPILSPGQGGTSTSGPSRYSTPPAVSIISPIIPPTGRYVRPRPSSMVHMNDAGAIPNQSAFPPPPVTQDVTGSKLVNIFGLDKLRSQSPQMSSFNGRNQDFKDMRNPTTKRAMSADAVSRGTSSGPESVASSTDCSRHSSWAPGLPLPGPPPRPAPSGSRSHSASGVGEQSIVQLMMPAPRPKPRKAPSLGTSLDPVPPTPANWTERGAAQTNSKSGTPVPGVTQRFIGISEQLGSASVVDAVSIPGPGLSRSAARRDTSAKGMRERRNSAKNATERTAVSPDASKNTSNPWSHTLHSNKSNPASPLESTVPQADCTVSDAPRQRCLKRPSLSLSRLASSPPFSPGSGTTSPMLPRIRTSFTSKALPTPPYSMSNARQSFTQDSSGAAYVDPNPPSPLRDSRPMSTSPATVLDEFTEAEQVMSESTRRHQQFLWKESVARDDHERLRLFSEYVAAESDLRRKRYSKAWAAGAFDVQAIKDSPFDRGRHGPSGSSSVSETTAYPDSEPPTPASSSSAQGRPESAWWSTYQPALSPIASMSNDEVSSRGRTSSRWWESHTGSGSDGNTRKVERTKREAKYMGLPQEVLQLDQADVETPKKVPPEFNDDADYPQEKHDPSIFGFHDDAGPSPTWMQPNSPYRLDVSRFITLPPSYPRHYPAVNNSHPGLVSFRTAVRTYSDLSEISTRKSRYKLSSEAMMRDNQQRLQEGRRNFRTNVQAQIDDGSISYSDAAEAEEAFKMDEGEIQKQGLQADFDSFQDVVLNPLHDMLNERVNGVTKCLSQLQAMLFSEAQAANLDQTQREGNEEPELLEKLTQLKWLFEAREQLEKAIFDLLSQRNEKYKAIVLLPYQQTNNLEKVQSTEKFFDEDARHRQLLFCNESLARHEEFLRVIQDHVSRGVELQSSTFWDIAPGILDLLQKIPANLNDFEGIRIPDQEYQENPSYAKYPFQYLYSLLSHAEKSTYQFIESQINMHCLLHEAKTGRVVARCKAIEAQQAQSRSNDSSDAQSVDVADMKLDEEMALTAELRQKTSLVEELWTEALGSQIHATKGQVKAWLVQEGGWDEIDEASV